MSPPAALLNSSATIYAENTTKGSMGQPLQSLSVIGRTKCRCDFKSQSQDGPLHEQTAETYKVYLPGVWLLTTDNWIKVVTPSGRNMTGQVTTSSDAGGLGHHTAVTIVCRKPAPSVTA
jgi:hypothetical protein